VKPKTPASRSAILVRRDEPSHPTIGDAIAAGTRGQSLGQMRTEQAGDGQGQRAVIDRNLGARENTLVRSMCYLRDRGRARSGEADVQDEVPDSQVEYPAADPVHDGR
jgi:hypothetical protein